MDVEMMKDLINNILNHNNSNNENNDKEKNELIDNNKDNEINEKQAEVKVEDKDNEKKIIYPENEEEENKLLEMALKESEELAKQLLEKQNEEERELQLAIKESEKYMNNSNNINNLKEKEEEEFDEEYGICPITQEYMENPVLVPSGNYYEKSAIIDWINKHNTDPMTREKLTVDMLIEDEEYKKEIIKYRKKFNK